VRGKYNGLKPDLNLLIFMLSYVLLITKHAGKGEMRGR
jgi:hypothetical protein